MPKCSCIFILIILLSTAACQLSEQTDTTLPTLAQLPTLAPTATVTATSTETPIVTPSATATITDTPIVTETSLPSPTVSKQPSIILLPSFTPTPPIATTPLPESFLFGRSARGRNLVANRFGTGQRFIMLIGGVHAGAESNTIQLVEQLVGNFQRNPNIVHPDITFILVPTLNPDGAALGQATGGRFNGNGVDLNRNWACGWSSEAYWKEHLVNAGLEAFDQPETLALGGLIQQLQPKAVIFYHAAADGVFAGDCGGNISEGLAGIYGTIAGYPFGLPFTEYPVSGTGPAWVNSIGIPAIDVELSTTDTFEYDRNLRAVMAVQQWVVEAEE